MSGINLDTRGLSDRGSGAQPGGATGLAVRAVGGAGAWLLRVFYESSDAVAAASSLVPGPGVGRGHHVSGINFDTAA